MTEEAHRRPRTEHEHGLWAGTQHRVSFINHGEDMVISLLHERQKSTTDEVKRSTLMRKMMILGSIMLGVLMLAPYGFADEGGKHGQETRMKVSGVVSKVQSSHVTIKT